jgi:hypothetical protein
MDNSRCPKPFESEPASDTTLVKLVTNKCIPIADGVGRACFRDPESKFSFGLIQVVLRSNLLQSI